MRPLNLGGIRAGPLSRTLQQQQQQIIHQSSLSSKLVAILVKVYL